MFLKLSCCKNTNIKLYKKKMYTMVKKSCIIDIFSNKIELYRHSQEKIYQVRKLCF